MAQPIRVPTGLPYGEAGKLAAAQREAPLAQQQPWQAQVVPLDAPTMRPNEPVTDGVPVGPGRTPAEAGIPGALEDTTRDGILDTLRGIYQAYPIPTIAQAILDFTEQTPWSIEDLYIDVGAKAAGNAWDALTRGEDSGTELVGLRPVGGAPPRKGMFDPTAPLDPSQVQDRRVAAKLGVGAAAGLGTVGFSGEDDDQTADPSRIPDRREPIPDVAPTASSEVATRQPITRMGRPM